MNALDSAQGFYETQVKTRVNEHPFPMLAAAVGAGYVLGGGLLTPTTARLVTFAWRMAQVPYFRQRLLGVADRTVDMFLPERSTGSAAEG
jgi:hypothetical protein